MAFRDTPAGELFDIIGRYRDEWGLSVAELVIRMENPKELIQNLSMLNGFVEYSSPDVLKQINGFMQDEPIFSTENVRVQKSMLLSYMTSPERRDIQVRQDPKAVTFLAQH